MVAWDWALQLTSPSLLLLLVDSRLDLLPLRELGWVELPRKQAPPPEQTHKVSSLIQMPALASTLVEGSLVAVGCLQQEEARRLVQHRPVE